MSEIAYAGTFEGNFTVNTSMVATQMNLPYNTSLYRVHMDTIFSAPFTGVGYLIGAYDDFADLRLTKLSADGETVTDEGLIISSGYNGYDALRSLPLMRLCGCAQDQC